MDVIELGGPTNTAQVAHAAVLPDSSLLLTEANASRVATSSLGWTTAPALHAAACAPTAYSFGGVLLLSDTLLHHSSHALTCI